MERMREIFSGVHLGMKVGSIHWDDKQGTREAEKRAGIIGINGDKDYEAIFTNAAL